MSRLDQSTEARLLEIADVFSSGQTELTGHMRRLDTGELAGRFKGGAKLLYPELKHFPETPGRIAEAIRKKSGRLYDRLKSAVRGELAEVIPERRRRQEKPTIPPHDALSKRCKVCGDYHGKGAHRFHGRGSYLQTHLFPFKNNMSLANARTRFARLMKVSRARALTAGERLELRRVSQILRADRKAGRRNPAPAGGLENFVRFLEAKGYLPSSLRPDIVRTLWKNSGMRRQYHEWIKGGSLLDKPTLFKNSRRQRQSKAQSASYQQYVEDFAKRMGWTVKQVLRYFKSGHSPKTKKNPKRGRGRLVRMGKLVELRYERDFGGQPGFYKHTFKSRPTLYFDPATNTITVR